MTEIKFDAAKWQQDSDNNLWLMLKVDKSQKYRAKTFVQEKKNTPYCAVIKENRERRSLDANAYCWALIGRLADRLAVPPADIYRHAIKDIGGNYEILPIRTDIVDRWKKIWSTNGLGWICEELGSSKLSGYTNVINYYGSSAYDRRQMGRLIDVIVNECKLQGIETKTPEELWMLKEEWNA